MNENNSSVFCSNKAELETKVGNMLDWTGERYLPFVDPKITGAEIHYEHLHRYAFASQLVKGKHVLDLASGEGYGSFMLSKKAASVVGVDIDGNAVAHARAKYPRENLEFKQGSILEVPINGRKIFDVVVCFEALEHVEDQDKLFSEVKRLLKDDGVFIVSTPNKKVYSDEHNYHNPFHIKELNFDDFRDILHRYFSNVDIFGQKVFAGSNIWQMQSKGTSNCNEFIIEHENDAFSFRDETDKVPLYFVSIASNASSVKIIDKVSYLVDKSNVLIYQRDAQIAQRDAWIASLSSLLQQTIVEASALKHEIAEMQRSIVWQMAMKYHYCFVEHACPRDTKRRHVYDLAEKSGRILVEGGFKGLWWHYNERNRVKNLLKTSKGLNPDSKKGKFELEDIKMNELVFPKSTGNIEVSIVIPVYNNAKYTYNCLKSIQRNTKGSFEIVIVDDASTDETLPLLENMKNIKVIKNKINQGFIDSCNTGAKLSTGKYILFLNNDTIVTNNWLEPLLELIRRDGVGAVGAKLVYPDGKLQEAGGIIYKDASGRNNGRGEDPGKPEYNFVREVDYCSGAALLVGRDLFKQIGGFDVRYKPAYYEDADLCFSIRKLGYSVLYQPSSTIIHFEGISCGTDINSGVKKNQEINKAKFLENWKDVLSKYHYEPDPSNLFLSRTRRVGKNILVMDRFVPTFDKDAGSYRMYKIIKIMIELGHKVTFIGDYLGHLEPYTSKLQQIGVEVIYEPYYQSIKDYLAINGKFFDIVILSRAEIAEIHIFTAKIYCNKAKIVFDTVDLHFLRESRRLKLENEKNGLNDVEIMKGLEYGLARLSDVTIVVSPVEKEIMTKEDQYIRVEIISLIHEVNKIEKHFFERHDLLFLGSFGHPPNPDAVKWFVKEIFPLIKERIPESKFYVVGNEPPEEIMSLASKDVIVTGYVENLAPYFEKCRVFVAPLRYGAGVKGKINQSMSYGLPVVTTSMGSEGMGLIDGNNALIADDAKSFSEKVVMLYENEALWNELSKNSQEHIGKNFSHKTSKERIKSLIDSL